MSRFPRSSLFYFALVVVLGLVFWFTWQSIQSGQSASDWDFSTMMTRAADGQVKSLEINGTDGIAVDSDGHKHNVVLPDCTGDCQFVTELRTADHVAVKYDKNSSGSYLLSVLLPNIILVILIAAFMWWVLRQTQSGNNQAISFGRSRARMIAGDKPAITFADVAWNAPFYAARGFTVVDDITPGLAALRQKERTVGLDGVGTRVVMRREL